MPCSYWWPYKTFPSANTIQITFSKLTPSTKHFFFLYKQFCLLWTVKEYNFKESWMTLVTLFFYIAFTYLLYILFSYGIKCLIINFWRKRYSIHLLRAKPVLKLALVYSYKSCPWICLNPIAGVMLYFCEWFHFFSENKNICLKKLQVCKDMLYFVYC